MRKTPDKRTTENTAGPSGYRADAGERLREALPELMDWFSENRREMPWRKDRDAYRVWISEIMLQQTRIETVKPYYARFLAELPDAAALAGVPDDRLMKLWQGLGYYSRARNLKKCAQVLVSEYGGVLPADYEKLVKLPGIGAYTAGAVASIAYGLPVPAVDGNVMRVLARFLADARDVMQPSVRKEAGGLLRDLLESEQAVAPGDFNEMIMEIGETVCLPNAKPLCERCPAAAFCASHAEGREEEYPLRLAKKERRVEDRTVFRLVSEGRILLLKRPEKGLLAGLYEFPGLPGKMGEAAARAFLKALAGEEPDIAALGDARHLFSHVEWRMTGYEATLSSRGAETLLKRLSEAEAAADLREGAREKNAPPAFPAWEPGRLVWMTADEMRTSAAVPGAFRAFMPEGSGSPIPRG